MMSTIKQGIITLLVSFAVFFFMPVVSFASSLGYAISTSNCILYNDYVFSGGGDASPMTFNYNSSLGSDYIETYGVFYRDSSNVVHFVTFNNKFGFNAYKYISPGYSGNFTYSLSRNFVYNGQTIYYHDLTKVPGSGNRANITDGIPMSSTTDLLSAIIDTIENSLMGSSSSLGYIKNVNYSHNNNTSSQGLYEIVSWGSTSTTGIDLTEKINGYDRYRVEFALRDQSTIAKNIFYTGFQSNEDILQEWERTKPDPVLPFDINSIVSRLAGGLAGGLAEHVYPYGGTNRAIKKGLITTAPSYNKMISMGDTPASNRRYAFNALHEYTTSSNFASEAPEIHSSLTGVYNTNLPNFLKGGWFESIVSNSNYYNIADYHLSYNIYARIVDTKDKVNGNWLLIDKHGQPIGAEDDRMKGGYTSRPIKLPDFNPGSDWTDAPDDVDLPDDEIEDNDTVKDEPLGTGYDDGSDNSGSGTTNIYNNYTYNYDNRSWIENHYDNETVQDANEGIDWLKLFSGFFSIFLILFGPFLPEWSVVLVTVATPIILGLAIFKVIKGIIPFV